MGSNKIPQDTQVTSQPMSLPLKCKVTETLKCPGFEDVKLPGYKGKLLQSNPAHRKASITKTIESSISTCDESGKLIRSSYVNRYLKMLTYTSNDTASDPAYVCYSDNEYEDIEL